MRALIGPSRTKMVLAAGQKISAQEAYAFGLIDRIVDPGALLAEAEQLSEPALGADPDLAARILAASSV
jgi:enoyl-CoA hydratase/carnithine racemase